MKFYILNHHTLNLEENIEQMTDKEIIIDGVNVAECIMHHENNEMLCMVICADTPNCYYKQLKRLEAENDRLKLSERDLSNLGYDIKDK